MAVLTKTILGIPKQSIADSMYFATWRGKACVKSLPASIRNPRTDKQQSYRFQFSLLAKMQSPLNTVIDAGYKDQARTGRFAYTALNAFIKYGLDNRDETFSGQGPDEWEINFANLKLAVGGLIGFATTTARLEPMSTDNNVIFTWTSDELAATDDQVYCVIYNEDLNLGKYTIVERSAETATVLLQDYWLQNGKTHCFIFAFNGKKASMSEYLGAMSN